MPFNAQAKPVDIVFTSGVRQDLDPHTAPVGSLVACDNLEFDQLGRLIKRDGFGSISTTAISKTNTVITQVRRFIQAPDGNRLLLSDDNAYQYVPALDKMSQAGLDGQSSSLRCNMTGVSNIVSDQTSALLFNDSTCVNGLIIYIYTQVRATGGAIDVCVDMIDSASGARLFTRTVLGSTQGTYQPRLVQSGSSNVVFALWEKSGGGTTIQYSKLDLGTVPFAWGAATDLFTTTGPAVFDAAPMANGWCVAYFNASTTLVTVDVMNSSAAVTSTFAWKANSGAATWTPSVVGICGDFGFSGLAKIHVVGYNPATQFIETVTLSTTLTGPTYGRFSSGLASTRNAVQLAISRTASAQTIYAFSPQTSGTNVSLMSNPRGHLYIYTMADTAVSSLQKVFANYSLGSRIYVDNVNRGGSIFLAGRFNEPSGLQSHYVVLDLGGFDLGILLPQPVCNFASGRVLLFDDNTITGLAGLADLGSGSFRLSAIVNIGANQDNGNQIQEWAFQSRGSQRFLSTSAQSQVILGGGTPLHYDGQRLVENSFYSWPTSNNGNYTPHNSGGFLSQGIYAYRLVWEWTDAAGNRHQSPASPEVEVDMSSATYVGGVNRVTITVPVIHATRKQGGPGVSDTWSPVLAVAYRTEAGPGSIFYRCPSAAVNSTSSASDVSFDDTVPDSFIVNEEVLYVAAGGQGLLAATAAPASIMITTHAQRVWGVDQENRERIWATRIIQDGTIPAYSPALQILIPGAGVINGLGGQDGKLYALASNGIYLATYGDGPDDTGGGVFPSPELITNTANCQDPRGVLVGQEGIFFTGHDQWGTGIYLIRRGDGQPVSIGKRVRNELAAYPVCRGVVNRVSKARTEFLFVDSDTAPTKGVILNYHHDYLDQEGIGQWTVTRVNSDTDGPGAPLECLGVWDDQSVTADTSNNLGWQQANVGIVKDFGNNFITTLLETTDIRPAGLVGYGKISGLTLLGTQSSADPLKVLLSYDSGFTWGEAYQWVASTESAGQPVLRQRQPLTEKLSDGTAIRVRITNPTLGGSNPGATFLHGITLEVEQLGGVARLNDARRS